MKIRKNYLFWVYAFIVGILFIFNTCDNGNINYTLDDLNGKWNNTDNIGWKQFTFV